MSLKTGPKKGLAARSNRTPPPEIPLADIHLDALNFWALDDDVRDGTFATLRREAPISFWPAVEYEGFEPGDGHWALTKHDDVFSRAAIRTSSAPAPTSRSTTTRRRSANTSAR